MKYYTILKMFFVLLFVGLILSPSSATILTDSNVSNSSIFKCQPSTIYANFSDDNILSMDAILSGQAIIDYGLYIYPSDVVVMTRIDSGQWQGTYGNNASLKWGLKRISFYDNLSNTYLSDSTIFVYSDKCEGTGISNYTQVSSGLGNYTKKLYESQFDLLGTSLDNSIIGWALYPWIQVWGYVFYVIVMFSIVTTIYLKTQNIIQPLVVGVFLLLIFASSGVVDEIYRQWVVFFIALALAAIYYKIFVKD